MTFEEFRAGRLFTNDAGERVSYIGSVDSALAKPGLLEGEEAEEFVD
jgi:hypothetical protein